MAVGRDVDIALGAVERHLGERLQHRAGLRRAGLVDGQRIEMDGVVARLREIALDLGIVAVLGLERRLELLVAGRVVGPEVAGRHVGAFGRRADGGERAVLERDVADDLDLLHQAGAARLLEEGDVVGPADQAGEQHVGAGIADLADDRRVVGGVEGRELLADHGGAEAGQRLLDHVDGDAGPVVVGGEQEELAAAALLLEELQVGRDLLGLDLAEHVEDRPAVAALVVVGIERRDVGLLGHRQRRDARRRGLAEDDDVDLLAHQLFPDLAGGVGIGGVVGHLQHELAAEHAAGGVDLVDGELGRLQAGLAEDAGRAAELGDEADRGADLVLRETRR